MLDWRSTSMKVIIVDDEPRAIELLESYLPHFSDIELLGTFRNAMKAIDFYKKKTFYDSYE